MTYLTRNLSHRFSLLILLLFAVLAVLTPLQTAHCNELSIIYWSDRHANVTPHSAIVNGEPAEVGSATTLSGMLKLLRAVEPNALTLVVGDDLAGTAVAAKSRGLSEIKLLNLIGIDAFCPGPHCFDYGWKSLLTVAKKAKFPIVLSNSVFTVNRRVTPLFPPDTTFTRNGIKVAVAGVLGDKINSSINQELIAGLSVWDPRSAAQEFITTRRKSSDILVLLSSLGWKQDSLLATQLTGVDVIIGSTDFKVFDPPREVNGVIIAQTGAYGEWLGKLHFDVDTVNHKINGFTSHMLSVDKNAAVPNEKVTKLIKKQEKILRDLDTPIGLLETEWDYNPNGQSNTAQWIADMVRYIEPRSWAAVIENSDVRSGLKPGQILESDMWDICPYDNGLIVFRAVGSEIKRMVKRSMDSSQPRLTWSRIQVKAENGEIKSLLINDEPILDNNFYLMTTTGSLWRKIDRLLGIEPTTRPYFMLPGVTQREIMIEAVTNLKTINAPLDDRWDVKP